MGMMVLGKNFIRCPMIDGRFSVSLEDRCGLMLTPSNHHQIGSKVQTGSISNSHRQSRGSRLILRGGVGSSNKVILSRTLFCLCVFHSILC
jgi:hypothetical protein